MERWPPLPLSAWSSTYATLHMWTQIVGKIQLAHAPRKNHWWHVALQLGARGLDTGRLPYGERAFQIALDFVDHRLRIDTDDGGARAIELRPRSVASFYRELMDALDELGLSTRIFTRPVEVEQAIRFEEDEEHRDYDAEQVARCWRVLESAHLVLERLRGEFDGKHSPTHFFWGSFDLASTRFSGRRAPLHPGGVVNLADWVVREAYSHECASCGFWPGGGPLPEPVFYAYAYPEPPGYRELWATGGHYHDALREHVLRYEDVRSSADPEGVLEGFFRAGFEGAARLGGWSGPPREGERPAPTFPQPTPP